MIPEIAATLGFAAGLIVGYAIARIREVNWRNQIERQSRKSSFFTSHESRNTNHGF